MVPAAGISIDVGALDGHIGNLVDEGSQLFDSLPSPQGRALWDELRQSQSPVAGLFREQVVRDESLMILSGSVPSMNA